MKLKHLPKHIDTISCAVNPLVNVMVFEGTARSSKTVDAIECFYYAVKISNDNLHCIACKDYNAIRDNILDCNGLGLLNKEMYPDVELTKDKIGGYFLTLIGLDGVVKKILLVGYANQNTWKAILGKTIGVFLVDEVNTASRSFIDETFARQFSSDRPLHILTLNGDDPKHFIYLEYINYCKPLGKVPTSILEDMNKLENKKGWYYWHWDFYDNPAMTEEKIERAKSVYPVDSYYYKTKVLGERGIAEGSIFTLLVQKPKEYLLYSLEGYFFSEITIGVDFGGSGNGDKAGGSGHSFTATGFGFNLEYVVVLASRKVNARGSDEKLLYSEFKEFCNYIKKKFAAYCKNINFCFAYCDNADPLLINGLKATSDEHRLMAHVVGAKKRLVNDRIHAMNLMLSARTIKWYMPDAMTSYDAYRTAVWNSKPGHTNERLDDGTSDIDSCDSTEYSYEIKLLEIQRKWGI